jgi:hypothetical protein
MLRDARKLSISEAGRLAVSEDYDAAYVIVDHQPRRPAWENNRRSFIKDIAYTEAYGSAFCSPSFPKMTANGVTTESQDCPFSASSSQKHSSSQDFLHFPKISLHNI